MKPEEITTGLSRWAGWLVRAPLLLSRRLWVFPLVGALVLGAVGWWVRGEVESTTRTELASRLQTLLSADVAALRLWFSEQEADARSFAGDPRVQEAVAELASVAQTPGMTPLTLANSIQARTLNQLLAPLLAGQEYLDYVLVGTNRHIIASPYRHLVGRLGPGGYDLFLTKTLRGELAVSRPFAREPNPAQRSEGPTMFVAAPVKNRAGEVIAVLGLRMKPEAEFSRILTVARMGSTGESYAFDRRGVMLTASRFEPELKKQGLIPNVPDATSILNLRLVDPGFDLTRPGSPGKPKRALRLTRMAASAVAGGEGVDVAGYRNYRGVPVVGAWTWLADYGMGVATEVETREAFHMLYVLREVFTVLFLLLVGSGVAIFAFLVLVERLETSVRKSALAARRIGQYVLVQEIGRGANGMVYRARHELLRRPVALKLLSPELTNEAAAARFEHEVQMTSQLTHPNTVAVYDYGRTPEGLFYYAMEFLSGIDLDRLVKDFGPQPAGRVIHILRQVCGSLAEAHQVGLIHRDIKPANIILTRRAGQYDVAKVLDFGLVKTAQPGAGERPPGNVIVGTPHFIAPEAVSRPQSVDARTDLYAVGAVGCWLLTGKTLFETEDVDGLLRQAVDAAPLPPSARLGHPVAEDLEALLMRCVAKDPTDRPATADAFEEALGHCADAGSWTAADAAAWWDAHLAGLAAAPAATMAEKTLVIAARS